MKVAYDKLTDTLYFEFKDTTVTTKRLSDDIALDYAEDGTLAGIEILSATRNIVKDWQSGFRGISAKRFASFLRAEPLLQSEKDSKTAPFLGRF